MLACLQGWLWVLRLSFNEPSQKLTLPETKHNAFYRAQVDHTRASFFQSMLHYVTHLPRLQTPMITGTRLHL